MAHSADIMLGRGGAMKNATPVRTPTSQERRIV
jgi:hypothetical protein